MGRIKDDALVSSSSLGGDTGDEVCRLPLSVNDNATVSNRTLNLSATSVFTKG